MILAPKVTLLLKYTNSKSLSDAIIVPHGPISERALALKVCRM